MSRRFNIIVTVVISVIFLGLTAVFRQSYVRFGETCKDFGLSAVYYVCELFGIDYSFTPTVTEYSGVLQWEILLPDDWDGFTASAKEYFALFMEHGTVYNLASVKTWVALKRSRFIRHRNAQTQLYGYDYAHYGTTFDDSLKIRRQRNRNLKKGC